MERMKKKSLSGNQHLNSLMRIEIWSSEICRKNLLNRRNRSWGAVLNSTFGWTRRLHSSWFSRTTDKSWRSCTKSTRREKLRSPASLKLWWKKKERKSLGSTSITSTELRYCTVCCLNLKIKKTLSSWRWQVSTRRSSWTRWVSHGTLRDLGLCS